MRTVGLIGGTGWPGTRDYYVLLNQLAQARLGGLHGLDLRVWSFDFGGLLARCGNDMSAMEAAFGAAARGLKSAGAQVLALASNTGHMYLREVHDAGLPVIHIAEACAAAMAAASVTRAGVLATRRALRGGVFDPAFAAASVQMAPPDDAVVDTVDEAIFSELEHGRIGPLAQAALAGACTAWAAGGVRDVLLGCTEIRPAVMAGVPVAAGLTFWDSTEIHCTAIIEAALAGG